MKIEIVAVGGYGESGRNMTAVRVGDEVVLFDMGLHLPNYIKLNDEAVEEWSRFTEPQLKKAGAVPDDRIIKDLRDKVVAIVISHAHLDHIGAVPYLAPKYNAPVICSPFSASIIRTILRDDKLSMPNKIVELKGGRKVKLTPDLTLEFVHITHSTPQTILAVLHTPAGLVVYGNDYKLDDYPTLGKPVNRDYLKSLGSKGVVALIQDCLYSNFPSHMPSEKVAKQQLTEVLLNVDSSGKAVVVTTFSSHIARLKTIVDLGSKLGRKVVLLGRSMHKYCTAAKDAGVVDLFKVAKITKYARQASRKLSSIKGRKDQFLLVVSGHQGEPESALSKMIDGRYPWKFSFGDHVIFSSKVIPADINIQQRKVMDEKLRRLGVRIFDNVHVSGHNAREDLRDVLLMLNPMHVFPIHGEPEKVLAFESLASELGYVKDKNLHELVNGQRHVL